jgi:hypothetical protein
MIVVIQCAGSKRANAGHLRTSDGRPVSFVARPELAPPADDRIYARPDSAAETGVSWREILKDYNANPGGNPFGLLPAFELYENPIYRALVERFGTERTYILSAGWGLIGAAFLTPSYDITFSSSAAAYSRRRKGDAFCDFRMLPDEPAVFFGSRHYVPLFVQVTSSHTKSRTVFYSSAEPPAAPGCALVRFQTRRRTNWQYECASAFLRERISTPQL